LFAAPWLPVISSNTVAASIAAATFLGSGMLREYARSRCFGLQQPTVALRINVISLVIGCIVFGIAVFNPDQLVPSTLFAILSFSAIVSSFFGENKTGILFSLTSFSLDLNAYRPIWNQAKWAFMGVVTTVFQGRGYVYLVTATAGLEAMASVAAAEIIFRPVGLLVTAWARISRPRLAALATESHFSDFNQILKYALLALFIAYAIVCGVIWLMWNAIDRTLYFGRYEGMGFLVAGWSLVVVLGSIRAIFSNALQSLKLFKPVAIATVVGSVAFLASAALVLPILGHRYILASLALAELVSLTHVLIQFRKYRRGKNWQFISDTGSSATTLLSLRH